MRFFPALIFILLFGLKAAPAASWQASPGTPVALVPPQGFHLSRDFTGFSNDQTRASILVAIFPADTARAVENLYNNQENFAQAMRQHNFTVANHINEKIGTGETITIYSGTQEDGKTVYDKWAALISHNGVYMVTLQSPKPAGLSQETALALFRSIRFGAWSSLEAQVSALPFSFRAIAPFVIKSTLMGSAVTLQTDSTAGPDSGPAFIYIIRDTQAQNSGDINLAQNLYLASIRQGFLLKTVTEETDIRFAGKEGKRLFGTGTDADGNSETTILYTALDDSHKAVYLQATGTENALSQLKETIGKIAESILLKPGNGP